MCEHSNFFSADNLVELGLGIVVARNLAECFNKSLDAAVLPMTCSIQNIHVSVGNHDVGPLNETEIRQLFFDRKLSAESLAWMPGMTEWRPIEQIPAILKIIASTSPDPE